MSLDDLHGAERKVGYLTEAVYRISGIQNFEPILRAELRKRAVGILASLTAAAAHPGALTGLPGENLEERRRFRALADGAVNEIVGLMALLRFAERIGIAAAENVNRVNAAYEEIRDALILTAATPDESIEQRNGRFQPPTNRQQRILEILKERGRAQLSDLRQAIGETCSEKTLQRELIQLARHGLVRRVGGTRWSTYFPAG